ncbi:hypothetical protein YenMTG1_234 [Yersinia phage vB_YenM_TG1]|uniref:DUF4326 domain-containing protein n=1 Tax=Yersinia phage vB_YenM_TG1 TaxID=1589265 RepID=A0A0B5A2Q8_9CAUD|nr:hypothetical protein AVV33_gp161 [Yersinia phage vB_YenM_TG1]AJD82044.1 hypothetical protein YenMTG1_234 [Yersinia phage vB_YenM_TG1]
MFGNYVGRDCSTRSEAIQTFKADFYNKIKSGEITRSHLEVLRGMRLGCTCKPKPCHGDIIAEVVNKLFKDITNIEELCT